MNAWQKKYGARRRAIDKAYLKACEDSIPDPKPRIVYADFRRLDAKGLPGLCRTT